MAAAVEMHDAILYQIHVTYLCPLTKITQCYTSYGIEYRVKLESMRVTSNKAAPKCLRL